jgi:multimeric flavodoxin WrbA
MKILAVLGSPHKGNTLALTQRFETELKKHGEVDFEYLHLKDANIQPCRGCFQCFVQGEDRCPIKDDDKPEIARKLDEADGVVFVTPVYSMHVSYLFKLFLDRFAYHGHRPSFFGKYAVMLAATGGMGLDETLKYMKDWFDAWGFEVVDTLGYIAPPRGTKYKALGERKDRTQEVARALFRAITDKKPRKLSFNDHIHFAILSTICRRFETMSPADYAFGKQQGWFEPGRKYFTDHAKSNFLFRTIAGLMARSVGRSVDKQIAKNEAT